MEQNQVISTTENTTPKTEEKKYSNSFFRTSSILIAVFVVIRILGELILTFIFDQYYTYHFLIERNSDIPFLLSAIICGFLKYYLIHIFLLYLLLKGNNNKAAKIVLKIFIALCVFEFVFDILRITVLNDHMIDDYFDPLGHSFYYSEHITGADFWYRFRLLFTDGWIVRPILSLVATALLGGLIVLAFRLCLRWKNKWWMFLAVSLLPFTISIGWAIIGITIALIFLLSMLGVALGSDDKQNANNTIDNIDIQAYEFIKDKLDETFVLYYNRGWMIMDNYGNKRKASEKQKNDLHSSTFSAGGTKFVLNSANYYKDKLYEVTNTEGKTNF